jgi:hypothetical protein
MLSMDKVKCIVENKIKGQARTKEAAHQSSLGKDMVILQIKLSPVQV